MSVRNRCSLEKVEVNGW